MKEYTIKEIRKILKNKPKEIEIFGTTLRGVLINRVFIYYEDFFIETNIIETIIFYINGQPSVGIEIREIKEIY